MSKTILVGGLQAEPSEERGFRKKLCELMRQEVSGGNSSLENQLSVLMNVVAELMVAQLNCAVEGDEDSDKAIRVFLIKRFAVAFNEAKNFRNPVGGTK